MIYRDFQGEKISALGFGTMRLPLKSDSDSDVDEELAAKMDAARKCKFRHTDYVPGIEEGQILMRCLKAARNRANDVIEVEAKVIDDHRSLCDTSKPKFEDRPPAWLTADINRSAGEMIR